MDKNCKFEPLALSVQHVGKRIKSSKIKYSWDFLIFGKKFTVDLYISRVSGKRRIFVNKNLFSEEKRKRFMISEFYLKISNILIVLKEKRENIFDMIVDEISFETEILLKKNTSSSNSTQRLEQNSLIPLKPSESRESSSHPEILYDIPNSSTPNSDYFNSKYSQMSWGNGKFK